MGEWATTTIAVASNNNLEIKKEIRFPHSLGLLYSAFTYYIGFKVNGGEYKLMGLAPYGDPIYEDVIYNNLIDVNLTLTIRFIAGYKTDLLTIMSFTNIAGSTLPNVHLVWRK